MLYKIYLSQRGTGPGPNAETLVKLKKRKKGSACFFDVGVLADVKVKWMLCLMAVKDMVHLRHV